MDPLVIVVEHRSWLWLVLVLLGVGLHVAWIRFGPRLSARLRAARLRARLGGGTFPGEHAHPARGLPGYRYRDPVTPWTYVGLVLPLGGDDKVRDVARHLGEQCLWDEGRVEQLLALHRGEGDPVQAAKVLAEHGRLADAA